MILPESGKNDFYQYAKDILDLYEIQKMSEYMQHGGVNCLEHSIAVAYHSYLIAERLNIKVDQRSLIRGALLHDFFLYDWHCRKKDHWWDLHGFTHPGKALKNASRYFDLNYKERNIILRHMWPLTIIPPGSREAVIVSIADKYCTLKEMASHGKAMIVEWVEA